MQGFIVISALLVCSLFSVGSALKCYHCAAVDSTIALGRSNSLCGDVDEMTSSDCSKWLTAGQPMVQTKFGILPLEIARVLGYDEMSLVNLKADAVFKCAKVSVAESQTTTGGTVKFEARAHSCIAETIGAINPWKACNEYSDCHLCDDDECNSASGIVSSLVLSIVLVALTLIRFQ